jgi:bacterioferritin-associated ferredoxin
MRSSMRSASARVRMPKHQKSATAIPLALSGMCFISSPAIAECQESILKANAIFIRATTHCKKNYMDTPAGYYALAMSRQCTQLGESRIRELAKTAMLELDQLAKEKGAKAACASVGNLEKTILKHVTNR